MTDLGSVAAGIWPEVRSPSPKLRYLSTVTVAGEPILTVTVEPAGSVAGFGFACRDRHAATRSAHCAADDRAFLPAENCAEHRAANRAAANLGRAFACRRFTLAIDRVGVDRQPRPVGQHDRVEADAEARLILQSASPLDERDRTFGMGARGNRDAILNARRLV